MLTENLQIYKDTKELARLLLTYQAQVPKVVRHTCSYNLRRRIWRKLSATYKGKYICYNFKKIKERKL